MFPSIVAHSVLLNVRDHRRAEIFVIEIEPGGPFSVFSYSGDPQQLPSRAKAQGPMESRDYAHFVMRSVERAMDRHGFSDVLTEAPVWRFFALRQARQSAARRRA